MAGTVATASAVHGRHWRWRGGGASTNGGGGGWAGFIVSLVVRVIGRPCRPRGWISSLLLPHLGVGGLTLGTQSLLPFPLGRAGRGMGTAGSLFLLLGGLERRGLSKITHPLGMQVLGWSTQWCWLGVRLWCPGQRSGQPVRKPASAGKHRHQAALPNGSSGQGHQAALAVGVLPAQGISGLWHLPALAKRHILFLARGRGVGDNDPLPPRA